MSQPDFRTAFPAVYQAMEALRRSEREYRRMVEASPDGMAVLEDGVVSFANGAMERLLGLDGPQDLWGSKLESHCHGDDADAWSLAYSTAEPGADEGVSLECKFRRGDGKVLEAEVALHPLGDGKPLRVMVMLHDIGPRKAMERMLRESEERYKGLASVAFDGVAIHYDGVVLHCNRTFDAIFGEPEGGLLGMDLFGLLEGEDQRLFRDELHSGRVLELKARRRDGVQVHVEACSRECSYQGEPAVMTALRDISPRKLAEEEVRRQAWHDTLTGLPNRLLFLDRLKQSLKQAGRAKARIGVLFLDLDRFKWVNDALGHAAGDELLKQVAGRLQALLRKGDTVSRLGGDEFTVLLSELSMGADALAVARKVVESLAAPFDLNGREVQVGASVGAALYPDHADDADRLIKLADLAMYRSKDAGRGQATLYSEGHEDKAVDRLDLEAALRHAISREEFEVYYQPKVEISTGKVVAAEALLRWRHPTRGLVGPDEFLPLAEETRLIVPLGEWVLLTTCLTAAKWQRLQPTRLAVSVNLSAWQFHKRSLLRTVDVALEASGLDPALLELEITETVAMKNPAETLETLEELTARGVKLSLDDFGKGYSSLNYLKQFPVHVIKIDQSFIREVPHRAKDASIVRAMILLAHNLGMSALAEGVETQDQLDFLRKEGCDLAQGWLFARALSGKDFEDLLKAGNLALAPK